MRALRPVLLALLAAAAVFTASCPAPVNYPGELVATFTFEVKPRPGGVAACLDAGYAEVPAPDASFTFLATFSGDKDLTIHWMTLNDFTRDASFDGQLAYSDHSAPRTFAKCGDAGVDEQLTLAFISLSQNNALRLSERPEDCTSDLLRPGALPFNPDAGITRPGPTSSGGWDSVKACGLLVDTIRSADDQACAVCTMYFDVKGSRL